MRDVIKTKELPTDELVQMRQRIAESERAETERKQAEEALSDTNAQFRVLQQVTAAVHSTLDLQEVFRQITDGAVYSLGYTTAFILVRNDEKRCFEMNTFSMGKQLLRQIDKAFGFSFKKLSIPVDEELNAVITAVRKGRMVVAKTLAEIAYPLISKDMCLALQKLRGTRNYIVMPLKVGEEVVGGLVVSSPREVVSEGELTMLQSFASAAAQAIGNANLHTQTKRVEEQLRSSEERLRILFEFAPDGYYLSDLKGNFVDGNKAAEQITGYNREELIGKNFLKLRLLPRQQIPKAATLLAQNVLGHATGPDEFTLNRKDGTQATVEIRTFPLKIKGETLVLSIARDITERKRMEDELRESEEKFRTFMETASDLMHIADKDGNITYVNESTARTLGYSKEEMVGKHVTQFLSKEVLEKDFKPKWEELITKGAIDVEATWVGRDGKEIYGEQKVVAIYDSDGKYLGSRAVFRDLTERKRAEHNLRERIKELNCLYSISRIVEKQDITLDELYQEVTNLLASSWQYPEITCARVSINGSKFETENYRDTEWKQTSDIKVRGEKVGVIEVGYLEERPEIDEGPFVKEERLLIDTVADRLGTITERMYAKQELQVKNEQLDIQNEALLDKARELKQANIHLQELDRLKSVFLASMSHELRTPLNSILGFTSLILQDRVGQINEEQRSQLTLVKSSANHLLSLINDILDISKIEAGKVELSLEEFRLNDVLTEVVETLSPPARLKGIEVLVDMPEGITLFSDQSRLKQVLMNLVGNAIKFTDQGSVKIAGGVTRDDNLEIHVIDTGMGIKKEDMDRLFLPFQQVDMSLTKKHDGTGLGLHISKKLVTLLGGDISAKSEYGRGSEFTLTIPRQYKGGTKNEESPSGRRQRG